jgi:hypothetical protein
MKGIGPGPVGQALEDAHIQIYGWVETGGNVSTAKTGYGGNAPAAYAFTPNILQLDQAVIYVERVPDTVQQDHIDWGFRVSGMYGADTRYTTAYGVFSNQLLYHNHYAGYDMPMVYGELYIPYLAHWCFVSAATSRCRHRGAARAKQLYVLTLAGLCGRWLHEHRSHWLSS